MRERSFCARRDFLKTAGLAAAALAAPACARLAGPLGGLERGKPPNILFIFGDDHACQAISAYGSKINKTPNIDRIAREGAIFLKNFCTNSICAPSRAVVLTGKHSHINGAIDNRAQLDPSQPTFPQLLHAAGYQTAVIGKWHLKTEPAGFDYWELLQRGGYYNPQFDSSDGTTEHTGYTPDIITDLALNWIETGRDPDRPFFIVCNHTAVHRTWAPGPRYLTMYDDVEIPEPPTLFDDYSGRNSGLKTNQMSIAEHMMWDYDLKVPGLGIKDALGRDLKNPEVGRMTPEQKAKWDAAYGPKNEEFKRRNPQGKELVRWKYQRYVKDYLRCVAAVDDNVGRMLDRLDESGLAENTVVVYSADQGFYLGEHGWYDKRWMYEESLRMPLLIRWPGVGAKGLRIEELTQNIDFAPTFLEMAGCAVPEDMQGESLVPFLRGRHPKNWRRSIYYHYYEGGGEHNVPRHYGVRTERYKLIHYYESGEWELFDLDQDPHELRNLYNDPSRQGTVAGLKAELKRLRRHYRDRTGKTF